MTSLEKLVSIASSPISQSPAVVDLDVSGRLGGQIRSLLRLRNGFYAFESALHVFPACRSGRHMTVRQWNSPDLWLAEYADLAEGAFFFAEDAFGNQFCIHDGRVCSFDAETGELSELADDVELWAGRVLEERNILTGYPLLHEWQKRNGAMPVGRRLMPKIPFVLGGDYSLTNLYSLGAISAMKSRGNLARQLKDFPDGTRVEFRVID